jgi:hypothetical protein
VLAQLDREACERLLSTQAPVALKFLAALNRGLTAALRTADRRLMQLNDDDGRTDEWHRSTTVAPDRAPERPRVSAGLRRRSGSGLLSHGWDRRRREYPSGHAASGWYPNETISPGASASRLDAHSVRILRYG